MTFADKLIRLRKINGMSQEDLADELGVSRQAISKWEGMLSVPDLQNVLKISELFGVTTDYLLKDSIGEDGKYAADTTLRAEKADKSVEEIAVDGGSVAIEETTDADDAMVKSMPVGAQKETVKYASGAQKDKTFALRLQDVG